MPADTTDFPNPGSTSALRLGAGHGLCEPLSFIARLDM